MLRIVLQPLSYLSIFVALVTTLFPGALISLPFPKPIRSRINAPFWKIFSALMLRVATLSKVYCRDDRDAQEKKRYPRGLFIANHQSFVDVPLFISAIPIPPIMKKEVMYIPILGVCGYAAGAIVVDRKDKDSRKKVFEQSKERLTTGIKALAYYPEGTRQRESDCPKAYDEIKKPIIHFAYEQNIPVYSVSIYGTKAVMPPDKFGIQYGKKIGIIVSKGKCPQDYPDAETFGKACWDTVLKGYDELQEKLT